MIVDSGCRDIGMAEPFLHFGDICLVVEGIGGGGRAQRVGADLEAERRRITAHQLRGVRCQRLVEAVGTVVANGAEEGAVVVGTVPAASR